MLVADREETRMILIKECNLETELKQYLEEGGQQNQGVQ